MGIVIRTAGPADIVSICRFGEQHVRAHYAPLLGQSAADGQVRTWWNEPVIGDAVAAGAVTVALAEAALVGVAQLGRNGAEHVIWKLYLDPGHRGQGLGPRLIDAVIEQLPADVGRIQLEHFVANERAAAFYDREGFSVERIDAGPVDNPGLGVVWRARSLRPTTGQVASS